jgi:hypothetical protein
MGQIVIVDDQVAACLGLGQLFVQDKRWAIALGVEIARRRFTSELICISA